MSPGKVEILLVDDEPGMLEVYTDTLQRGLAEARVVAVSQPRQAVERLKRERYDLLVTNVNMPGLNGLRLLQLAKREAPDMPVLVVTGYPMRETADEARRLGAADYLTKPFDPAELLARICAILDAQSRTKGS